MGTNTKKRLRKDADPNKRSRTLPFQYCGCISATIVGKLHKEF